MSVPGAALHCGAPEEACAAPRRAAPEESIIVVATEQPVIIAALEEPFFIPAPEEAIVIAPYRRSP